MIRVASVGYGDIARRRHFPELLDLRGRAELVAIAGRDEPSLAACARELDIPDWYSDADEMLARDDIDAVLILTPPGSHSLFARRAIEAGKHVLLEKPMVMSVEEATGLLEALRTRQDRNPITFLPLPHVDIPEHKTAARLIAAGAIGEATSVECHRGHRGPTHAGWFYRKELAGGGVLFDLGIYQVSAVVSLFGPARTVTALCDRRFETRTMDDGTVIEPDVEDSALVSLRLENGMAASINANWNGYVTHRATRRRVTVVGREGSLHFGVDDGGLYIHRSDDDYGIVGGASEETRFDGYACRRLVPGGDSAPSTVVGDFVNLIETGETSTRALEMQVHVMEIIFEAYRAGDANGARALTTRF